MAAEDFVGKRLGAPVEDRLAGAFAGVRPATEISYAADPFGVACLVATLT